MINKTINKIILSIFLLTAFAFSAEGGAPHLDGADLSILWVFPFVGILLSIAIFPLLAHDFWHHNFGKISAFWAALFIIPFLFNSKHFKWIQNTSKALTKNKCNY